MIGHGFWAGPGWGLVGFLVMAAFWVLVVMIIVGLVRGRGARRGLGGGSGAVKVLEERYARGEIDRDEFLERQRYLLGQDSPTEPLPPSEGST
jgi:putative membrane protein